jgi:hypothetical protein
MTLAENVSLPLEQYPALEGADPEVAAFKLALVGLAGFETSIRRRSEGC